MTNIVPFSEKGILNNDFFTPMQEDLIDLFLGQYQQRKQDIVTLHEAMNRGAAGSVLPYFINGNVIDQRHTIPRTVEELFALEGAIAQLNAEYWDKTLNQTDVLDWMPQKRRTEWHEMIRAPLGVKKTGYSAAIKWEVPPLPHFEEDAVRSTIMTLLDSRAKFFAEKVDGLFTSLSRTHVTNQPEGFNKRMILAGVVTEWGIDWEKSGYINDLRGIIAKFMGRDDIAHGNTDPVIKHIRKENGTWHSIDGGVLRMRIYNGVGTAHLEVHPSIAWRLNSILASLHPAAIPAKFRKKPAKQRKIKDFELFDNLLPFTVVNLLAVMEPARTFIKDGFNTTSKIIENSLKALSTENDKATLSQVASTLEAIGGTFNVEEKYWQFDYDPTEIIGEIVTSGRIPDQKSHQFYPTPEKLALKAVELAKQGLQPEKLIIWLEPSAGTGGLADYIPVDKFNHLHCYEINALHCQIMKAKGYGVTPSKSIECLDFLKLAKDYRGGGYDRIVMNPPYSEGRWQAHLEAAAKMLRKDGLIVAILPASTKDKTLIKGAKHTYSKVYSNEFTGTSIAVVIVTITKPK